MVYGWFWITQPDDCWIFELIGTSHCGMDFLTFGSFKKCAISGGRIPTPHSTWTPYTTPPSCIPRPSVGGHPPPYSNPLVWEVMWCILWISQTESRSITKSEYGEGVVKCTQTSRNLYYYQFKINLASSTHPIMLGCNILIYIISKRCFSMNGQATLNYSILWKVVSISWFSTNGHVT